MTCTDRNLGRWLHAYELGWLEEEEAEAFELHCLDCHGCFEQARAFRDGARYLSTDPDAIAVVREELARSERRADGLRRFWRLVWPRRPLLFRPAVAYLTVLLLLPLAYRGFRTPDADRPRIAPVQTVDLVALRSAMKTIRTPPGEDLILRFAFGGARPGHTYRVSLATDGVIFYAHDAFALDAQRVGYLRVPAGRLTAGTYELIVVDPQDTSALGTDTLHFAVER